MEQVLLPLFVGDQRDLLTKRFMSWLFLNDFPIGNLLTTPLTPDYIPVIHTELIKEPVLTEWPWWFKPPQWCSDRHKVFLFRECIFSECPQGDLLEIIDKLVSPE